MSRRQCSRSGCAERAVVSLTYEYAPLVRLAGSASSRAGPPCVRPVPAPRRGPVRAPRLEACRTGVILRSVVWNRPVPSSSERQIAPLGWVDVRGVVSRAPLRDAGRRVDVPVAVATWVIAFVVGQARFGDHPRLLGRRRRRSGPDPHPVRRGRGDVDRLPGRDVGGVPALGVRRLRRGLPAPLRAHRPRRPADRGAQPAGPRPAGVPPVVGAVAGHVLGGSALGERREARRPRRRRVDGAPRAHGLPVRARRRGARLPGSVAELVRRPVRPRARPAHGGGVVRASSTSARWSTRGSSCSASWPAPACSSPAGSDSPSSPTSRSTSPACSWPSLTVHLTSESLSFLP